jgi:hypothetical protein
MATEPVASFPVKISTDKSCYRVGDPIQVTVTNTGTKTIYIPANSQGCSVANVYRLEGQKWILQDQCGAARTLPQVAIPPGKRLTGNLVGPEVGGTFIIGPVAAEPTPPHAFDGKIADLPKVKPWQPGDPTWEVPRGAPSEEGVLPFASLVTPLHEGKYRVHVRFTVGVMSAQADEARSGIFRLTR